MLHPHPLVRYCICSIWLHLFSVDVFLIRSCHKEENMSEIYAFVYCEFLKRMKSPSYLMLLRVLYFSLFSIRSLPMELSFYNLSFITVQNLLKWLLYVTSSSGWACGPNQQYCWRRKWARRLFHLHANYPSCPPDISISSTRLSRTQCHNIREKLLDQAAALPAEPMVHQLMECLQVNSKHLKVSQWQVSKSNSK